MGKQINEVPQWAKDFINRRRQQLLEESRRRRRKSDEEQATQEPYLLCPFGEHQVQVIRTALLEFRAEARAREVRRSGYCQGSSLVDPTFDLVLEEYLLVPMNRQGMQEAVVKCYDWVQWADDPWGNFQEFCRWIDRGSDRTQAVWAVNETLGGRVYLSCLILNVLVEFDYSAMSAEELARRIGVGASNFLCLKSYSGWDDFDSNFPEKKPIPARLVSEAIVKVFTQNPFTGYADFIMSIYLWRFLLKEFQIRTEDHPEVASFLDYHVATDTSVAEICQKLAPEGYQVPSQDQAWEKLEWALHNPLKAMAIKYDGVYCFRSELKYDGDILDESYVAAQENLLEALDYWKSKAYKAMVAGLKGELANRFLRIVKNNFIDAARKDQGTRKHEVTESIIDNTRVADDDTHFLDTLPGPETVSEEAIAIEELGLNIDALTAKELWVVRDVFQAFKEGYDFDSKQGQSFQQRWGNDYESNKKAWQRAKAKLK